MPIFTFKLKKRSLIHHYSFFFTYLCGVEQNEKIYQSQVELDEKTHYIRHTQQGEKSDNASQTSPVKIENM